MCLVCGYRYYCFRNFISSNDGYYDEEVFCGKPKDVPECYTDEKVTEWIASDNSEIVLYIN